MEQIIRNYKLDDPSQSIPRLLKLKDLIFTIEDSFWKEIKIKEVEDIIYSAQDYF